METIRIICIAIVLACIGIAALVAVWGWLS